MLPDGFALFQKRADTFLRVGQHRVVRHDLGHLCVRLGRGYIELFVKDALSDAHGRG